MEPRVYLRQKWTRYLGELRPIHDIYVGNEIFPSPTPSVTPQLSPTNTSTPTATPSVTPTMTPTNTIAVTPTTTPTNTISPTPSITPDFCCETLVFSGKNATFSAFTGTYTKQPMSGGYYGYMDDSPAFTIKCQIFNGLYWSVWKSANNDVIIYSEQTLTWRVVDNQSTFVNCLTYSTAFTYQNITNLYVTDCSGLQIPPSIDNSNYSLSYSGCGLVPTPTTTMTPSVTPTKTPASTPTPTPSITSSPTPTRTSTATPAPSATNTPSVTPSNTSTPQVSPTSSPTNTPSPTLPGCQTNFTIDNNTTGGGIDITDVTFNGFASTYVSGDSYPIAPAGLGTYKTPFSGTSLTVIISYDASNANHAINVVDCAGNSFCCDNLASGVGSCTFEGVYVDCTCSIGLQIIANNGDCV